MKRLYEDYAYGPEPIKNCFWDRSVPLPQLPPLSGSRKVDVAVIGAGYTGLSAALHLAQDGAEVAVVDAETPFWGASGRNGGFCCLGGAKASDKRLVTRFGNAGKTAFRRSEKAAVTCVADLITRHGIKADCHSNGETVLAHRPQDMTALRRQAIDIKNNYGVEAHYISAPHLSAHGMTGPFHGAMTIPIGFALNPRKYANGLLCAAQSAGAKVFANSPVTKLQKNQAFSLNTPQGQITAEKVIFATNGYSSDHLPNWMRGRYLPVQSSIIVTRPLTASEQAAQGWTSLQMAFDSRELLHYFRLMPDGRFLFGMRGGIFATARANKAAARKIKADFRQMFPAWADVGITDHWSGLVCLTRNLTPYIGPVPGLSGAFAGFAWHGNGIAMGSYAGAILADLLQNKASRHPYPAALKTIPNRFPAAPFRRHLLHPAYVGLALKDL